jgi:hypothetical protein
MRVRLRDCGVHITPQPGLTAPSHGVRRWFDGVRPRAAWTERFVPVSYFFFGAAFLAGGFAGFAAAASGSC